MVYQYKWGNRSYPVSAQAAGEYLHDMSEREGCVAPGRVLDEARADDALLHPCFEWDDTKAAEAHRLYQARKLIGHLVCTIVQTPEDKQPVMPTVRAFVNTASEEKSEAGRYCPVVSALSDVDARKAIFENAKLEAVRFRRKYSNLVEFAAVFAEIDKVVAL